PGGRRRSALRTSSGVVCGLLRVEGELERRSSILDVVSGVEVELELDAEVLARARGERAVTSVLAGCGVSDPVCAAAEHCGAKHRTGADRARGAVRWRDPREDAIGELLE